MDGNKDLDYKHLKAQQYLLILISMDISLDEDVVENCVVENHVIENWEIEEKGEGNRV